MSSTLLLRDIWLTNTVCHTDKGSVACLQKAAELSIVLGLVLQPFLSDRKVAQIGRVRNTELSRSIEEDVTNAFDYRRLLSLPDIHYLK